MSWIQKLFSSSTTKPAPKSIAEVMSKLDGISNAIQNEVTLNSAKVSPIIKNLEVNPLMKNEEIASALESIYWASALLKLIEKAEKDWIPSSWVPQLLNDILNEMESEKRGCKVRFARQMLQEYAEMNAKSPNSSYDTESKLAYFYCWLWECLKKKETTRPPLEELTCFAPLLSNFVEKDVWAN